MDPQIFLHHGGLNQPYPTVLPDKHNSITIITIIKSIEQIISIFKSINWFYCDELIVLVPSNTNIQAIHPKVSFIQVNQLSIQTISQIVQSEIKSRFFYLCLNSEVPLQIWDMMRTLPETIETENPEVRDDYIFMSSAPDFSKGIRINSDSSPAHSHRLTIQEMTINTTGSYTELCKLACKYGTDKSTYNIFTHRHPYTPVYNIFLGQYRNRSKPIRIAEIGVLNGASIKMWHEYFGSETEIHAFDISQSTLDTVSHIPHVHTHLLDSGNVDAINTIFGQLGEFDIIIEDASHRLEHQVTCVRECIKFLSPGGTLVVEDIFRAIPVTRFQDSLNTITNIDIEAFMITPEDELRFSPNWENDRLLIIRRV